METVSSLDSSRDLSTPHHGNLAEAHHASQDKSGSDIPAEKVNAMKKDIMSFMHRMGGDVTFADLSLYVDGFKDDSWMATSRYQRETLRAANTDTGDNSNSSVIVWEGHTKVAGEAILQLLTEGKIFFNLCSSKRYRNSKLKYPIIRRKSDAVRSYDELYWVPINLLLPEQEMKNLDRLHPTEKQVVGDAAVCFYNDKDFPVRVEKNGCVSSYDSACEFGIVYDDSGNEAELSDFEQRYLLTMKSEVASWEEQFEDD